MGEREGRGRLAADGPASAYAEPCPVADRCAASGPPRERAVAFGKVPNRLRELNLLPRDRPFRGLRGERVGIIGRVIRNPTISKGASMNNVLIVCGHPDLRDSEAVLSSKRYVLRYSEAGVYCQGSERSEDARKEA